MAHQGLSDSTFPIMDISAQIASANVNGLTIDTQGWDGICYTFSIGTMASGATFDARLVSSANSNMSGNTNVTNALLVQVANTGNTVIAEIDLYKSTNRYVRSAVQPATANSTFSCVARLYNRSSGTNPATANANTAQTVKVAQN